MTNEVVEKALSVFDDINELREALTLRAADWKIILRMMDVEEKTESGIILHNQTIKDSEYMQYVGRVIDVGPLAFTANNFREHENLQPVRTCEIGDWIVINRHGGQEALCYEGEGNRMVRYRIINDDNILAVANDPKKLAVKL